MTLKLKLLIGYNLNKLKFRIRDFFGLTNYDEPVSKLDEALLSYTEKLSKDPNYVPNSFPELTIHESIQNAMKYYNATSPNTVLLPLLYFEHKDICEGKPSQLVNRLNRYASLRKC